MKGLVALVPCQAYKSHVKCLPPGSFSATYWWWTSWYVGTRGFHLDWLLAVVHLPVKIKRDSEEARIFRNPFTHKYQLRSKELFICLPLLTHPRLFLILGSPCLILTDIYHRNGFLLSDPSNHPSSLACYSNWWAHGSFKLSKPVWMQDKETL